MFTDIGLRLWLYTCFWWTFFYMCTLRLCRLWWL